MRTTLTVLALTAVALTTATTAGTAQANTPTGFGGTVQSTHSNAVAASDGGTTTFAKKTKAEPVSPSAAYLNTQSKRAVRYVHCVV